MRLKPSEEDIEFRDRLRTWLGPALASLPPKPPPDDWPAQRAYDTGWQRRLFDASYAGAAWPVEHGGQGASPSRELIFIEETERAGAPYVGCNFVGTLHAGPTIAAVGTPEQRAAHLRPILRGDHVWCQGFSEPEAGSDLASLRTRAVRDGDHFVVTGQKMWTSHAHIADYCELLVRTDPEAPKHRGISWLIMPMDTPGIDVRPLRTLTGVSEFSEMFLDEVRIPVANLVGLENDGWRVAMVTFGFERGTAFVSELLRSQVLVEDLTRLADESTRRELRIVAAELDALWAYTKRNVSRAARSGNAGAGGSIFKLAYHESREHLGELAMRILGRDALYLTDVGEPGFDHVEERLYTLSLSIAAGTAQIQRNIVAERVLGLPKEPTWTSS